MIIYISVSLRDAEQLLFFPELSVGFVHLKISRISLVGVCDVRLHNWAVKLPR